MAGTCHIQSMGGWAWYRKRATNKRAIGGNNEEGLVVTVASETRSPGLPAGWSQTLKRARGIFGTRLRGGRSWLLR